MSTYKETSIGHLPSSLPKDNTKGNLNKKNLLVILKHVLTIITIKVKRGRLQVNKKGLGSQKQKKNSRLVGFFQKVFF